MVTFKFYMYMFPGLINIEHTNIHMNNKLHKGDSDLKVKTH